MTFNGRVHRLELVRAGVTSLPYTHHPVFRLGGIVPLFRARYWAKLGHFAMKFVDFSLAGHLE